MHKPLHCRLSFVNAAEDVPRLIRAYGKACDGEWALVLRPPEHRGALVQVTKDGAKAWRSTDGDAPKVPELAVDAKDAVALMKTEQKAVPKPGSITLRGQWSGHLACEGGKPRVELARKLATYGVLRIHSKANGTWHWTVERTEKWFSKPGADKGEAPTLVKAIEVGLARAMGLLGEACSVRDSTRRAAKDEGWAKEHPIRVAKEGKDPVERLKTKASKVPAKSTPKAPGWKYVTGELPDAEPIERPTKAMLAKLKSGGLVHDAGAGSYLGALVEARGAFPVGSLVFRRREGDGVYLGALPADAAPKSAPVGKPVAARTAKRKPKGNEPVPDAEKDKALLDAFSAAVASAMNDA